MTPCICTFTLHKSIIEIPEPPHLFCVTFEAPHPARCSCDTFKQMRECAHTKVASGHLFSEPGYWRILELLDAQIPKVKPDENDVAIFHYNGLMNLKGEIEQRLGLHEDVADDEFDAPASRVVNCRCGQSFPGGDEHTRCYRCKRTVGEAWQRYYSGAEAAEKEAEMGDYDDSDPFADEPAPSVVPARRPASYYAAGLML
jgi:hypothetical protein